MPGSHQTADEAALRSLLRDKFKEYELIWCEPGYGTGSGQPDALIRCEPAHATFWVPLELKAAPDPVAALRPDQARWHRMQPRTGGCSLILNLHSPTLLSFLSLGSNLKIAYREYCYVAHFTSDWLRSRYFWPRID